MGLLGGRKSFAMNAIRNGPMPLFRGYRYFDKFGILNKSKTISQIMIAGGLIILSYEPCESDMVRPHGRSDDCIVPSSSGEYDEDESSCRSNN